MIDRQTLLNQSEPVRHRIIVDTLDAMAKLLSNESDFSTGSKENQTVDTTLWGAVSIGTPKCSNCQFCSKFCPTGALQSNVDKTCGELTITHTPALCVQCGLCADICQTNAISLSSDVTCADLREQTVRTIYKAKVENLTTPFSIDSPAQAIQSIVGDDTTVRLR